MGFLRVYANKYPRIVRPKEELLDVVIVGVVLVGTRVSPVPNVVTKVLRTKRTNKGVLMDPESAANLPACKLLAKFAKSSMDTASPAGCASY